MASLYDSFKIYNRKSFCLKPPKGYVMFWMSTVSLVQRLKFSCKKLIACIRLVEAIQLFRVLIARFRGQ